MVDEREAPEDAAGLYEARGDVPWARPIMQGDVFTNVELPGFDGKHDVMITQHPCSMRQGAALRERLSVALAHGSGTINKKDWQGHASEMLLPDVDGAGSDARVDFREAGVVPSAALTRAARTVALSNYGVHVLQQRLVFYQTRLTIDVPTLSETFDPIGTETELQWEWVEAALAAAPEGDDAAGIVADAEMSFTAYLDENDRERRTRLQESVYRADVRRQVRNEIRSRFGTT